MMNSKKFVYFAVTAVLLFMIFNPFESGRVKIRGAGRGTQLALYEYVLENYQTPSDYLLSLFDDREVVIIGEQQRFAEQAEFVSSLIPELDRRGIRALGIEYANASDQELIDRILTAEEYNEEEVQQVLFNYLVIWGFREYADLFRSAWEVNRAKEEGEKPFRIIGLNVERNWEVLQTREDLRDPAKKREVLAKGLPDQVMADTVLGYIDDTGEKIAVFCSFQSSFTRFQFKAYVEQALAEELPTTLRMGNILYEALGDDVVTVLLHGPWLDNTVMTGMNYPFQGAVDKLIRDLPEDKKTFGVPVGGTPFEELQVSGDYAEGYDSLTLGELAGGYLSLGPLSSYHAAEPIPGFIDEKNYKEGIRQFPGPNPGAVSPADLNEYISTIARDLNEALKKFR